MASAAYGSIATQPVAFAYLVLETHLADTLSASRLGVKLCLRSGPLATRKIVSSPRNSLPYCHNANLSWCYGHRGKLSLGFLITDSRTD
ncbi:hypothetical protein DENSPDRAFT_841732 [Dentipellis sp. KUC8613]|nr:hypothetical protein DENSPDRAFT_841732 [Dentipellis sp. KUC8613]